MAAATTSTLTSPITISVNVRAPEEEKPSPDTCPAIDHKAATTPSLTSTLFYNSLLSFSKVGESDKDEGKEAAAGATEIDTAVHSEGDERDGTISAIAAAIATSSAANVVVQGDLHEDRRHLDDTNQRPAVAAVREEEGPDGLTMTFFDDMVNARPAPLNILQPNESTSLPELYHDFFESHYELLGWNHHHHRPSFSSEGELSGMEGEGDEEDEDEEARLVRMDLDFDLDMMDLDKDLDEEVAHRIRDRAMVDFRQTMVAAASK